MKKLKTGVFTDKPEKVFGKPPGTKSKPSSVPRDLGWRDLTHGEIRHEKKDKKVSK